MPDTRLIVRFRAGVSEVEQRDAYASLGRGKALGLAKHRRHLLVVPQARARATLAALRADDRVAVAALDTRMPLALTPNDPGITTQWHHTKIGSRIAWDLTTGAPTIIIAILDTGVDGTHPDLVGRMVGGYNVLANSVSTGDGHGHGTKVAGVAASTGNNGIGGAGVAYGCRLMPIVIADSAGFAYASDIVLGIDWAVDHGARVLNISIDGVAGDPSIIDAAASARAAGAWVVAGSGNCSCVNAIAATAMIFSVGATTQTDALASFSSRGAYVDLAAPGVSIYTTAAGGGYTTTQGTSFSGPIVAAVGALLLSYKPTLTLAQLETALTSTAADLGTAGYDQSFGYGRVDAGAALASIVGTPTPDTTPPTVTISSVSASPGLLTVTVTATDTESGVAFVRLYINGTLVATDTVAPYQFTINTTPYAAGTHTLTAVAQDVAGNSRTSAAAAFTISPPVDPPSSTGTCVITSAVITGGNKLAVQATATDPTGITKVDCYLDGVLKKTDTTTPYTFSIGVGGLKKGTTHQVQCKATNGNAAAILSAPVAVTK